MSIDLSTLTYSDLLKLQCDLATVIAARKDDEEGKAKKEWMTCEQGGKKYLSRIEELRKKYEKLCKACEKGKSTTLRIKMSVDLNPVYFDELLHRRWGQSVGEVFQTECNGQLLNPDSCGHIGTEVQDQIDNTMGNLCEESIGIHGGLKDQLDGFMEEYNGFMDEFVDDSQAFHLTPSEVVKANKPKAKKQAAKKAVKKGRK